ncbi:MAG: VWA domain-containing protein [Elusimicrobia bacterium]|nr:VWA domain-containing protein [Elusimicrobiota bacterium]
MAKENGRKNHGLKLLLLFGLGVWYVRYRSQSPGPATGAPPPARGRRPAAGLMKFDWPRGAGEPGKVELNQDLATRNYYVVLDGSGSMADRKCSGQATKMEAAKQALAEFSKAVPASAQLGLLAFDGRGISERVPLGRGNRDRFLQEVRSVTAAGGTPLKSAIALGVSKLEDAARRQLGYGEYNLVIVTDGEAGQGEDPRGVVDEILARSPVMIHTIGFCIGKNHSLNQPGRTVYRTADNPAELRSGLGEVLAESATFDVAGFAAPKGGERPH